MIIYEFYKKITIKGDWAMKKLTTIALLFTMIGSMFLLSACSEEEEDLSSKIEEKVVAYQTDLEDSASTLTSTEAIRDYLSNWAKSKGIKYTVDDMISSS